LHRHDVVIVNDMQAYFILNRPIATKFHELHPGRADTARVQKQIISELEKYNVSLIVLKKFFEDPVLDRVKAVFRGHLPEVGATELDDYIWKNYEYAGKYGPYLVLLRKRAARVDN
jgi:hypothetical protein